MSVKLIIAECKFHGNQIDNLQKGGFCFCGEPLYKEYRKLTWIEKFQKLFVQKQKGSDDE